MFWDFQIAIVLLLAFYYLVLRGRVSLGVARIFLLLIVPVAAILAFVDMPVLSPVAPIIVAQNVRMVDFASVDGVMVEHMSSSLSWIDALTYVYWTGVVVIGLYLLFVAANFSLLLSCSRHIMGADSRLRFTLSPLSGVSFFSSIIVGYRYFNSDKLPVIIAHEQVHARKLHSLDVIYYCIVRALLWFNPAVWISARALREVHEAQADRRVIEQGFSPSEYIETLLRAEAGLDYLPTNSLSYLKTKNRIKMITNKKPRHTALRLLLALPLVGGMAAFMSFTHPVTDVAPDEELTVVNIAQSDTTGVQYRQGTISYSINGKDTVTIASIKSEPISKAQAEALKASDIDMISIDKGSFVIYVNKGHKVNDFITVHVKDPKNVRVSDVQQYLRKIGATKVNYSQPKQSAIVDKSDKVQLMSYGFRITDKASATSVDKSTQVKSTSSVFRITDKASSKGEPLVIIDGKEGKMDDVKMDNIESFSVLKAESAIEIYGEKAKHGVIIISTEKGKSEPLVIIDGKEGKVDDVKKDNIESFSVLKDESAIKIYGEKAKNGVIIITTKKAKTTNK